MVRVQVGVEDMRCEDRVGLARIEGTERLELLLGPDVGHVDDPEVRIGAGAALTGEVLRGATDRDAVHALDERRRVGDDDVRIGREGPIQRGDDRVVGVDRQVDHGRKVERDPDGGERLAIRRAVCDGHPRIASAQLGRRGRRGEPVRRTQARDLSSLLIDRHEQRGRRRSRGEPADEASGADRATPRSGRHRSAGRRRRGARRRACPTAMRLRIGSASSMVRPRNPTTSIWPMRWRSDRPTAEAVGLADWGDGGGLGDGSRLDGDGIESGSPTRRPRRGRSGQGEATDEEAAACEHPPRMVDARAGRLPASPIGWRTRRCGQAMAGTMATARTTTTRSRNAAMPSSRSEIVAGSALRVGAWLGLQGLGTSGRTPLHHAASSGRRA